jgi:Trk K+ transport system NAD-binding subunit
MYSTFILVSIVTCIVSPILFAKLFPKQAVKKETLLITGNVDFLSSFAGKADLCVKELVLCDTSAKTQAIFDKRNIAYDYWADPVMVSEASLVRESVKTFVAAYDDDGKNVELCMIAKKAGVQNVIALIQDPMTSYDLERKGVRSVTPIRAMHTLLLSYILYPESFDVLFSVQDSDDIDVREIELDAHAIVGQRLRDLHLPGDCLVLMVSRDARRIVPDGNTRLEKGDVLVIIGSKEYTAELDGVIS